MAEPTWAIVADYATRLSEAEKTAAADRRWWLGVIALMRFGVPVEKPVVGIPLQRTAPRLEVDLWPRSVIRDAAPSRFLDSRNSPTP